jgi:NAD(P)H-hydrate epimerase
MGVWVHGRAGDLARRDLGMESLIAGDLISYLPKALMELHPKG